VRLHPRSPYAVSKVAAENYVSLFSELYGLTGVCLRYFNVYGPGARSDQGVIPIFINKLLKNRRPVIYGDGEQTRDFIYIDDVVEANLLAMKSNFITPDTINIGSGKPITINTVIETLKKILNKKDIDPVYKNMREGDIKHSYADIRKTESTLNFKPKIDINEGFKKLIEYQKNTIH